MDDRICLHVEVCQKATSVLNRAQVELLVEEAMTNEDVELDVINAIIDKQHINYKLLQEYVDSVICSSSQENEKVRRNTFFTKFHIYKLSDGDGATETMLYENEEISVASHWILPSKDFHTLWENLHFEQNLKNNLLQFVQAAITFADHKVNPNVINCNKIILLHGPPGTGKSSLCRALAQKTVIRLGDRFTHGQLIEINSHSLFSKWFSESGKLVMKVFDEVRTLLEDPKALIFILIDEIESLAHVRKAGASEVEPTDSIRVVNALLTQLDQIKHYPNVVILTTSNLTEAIDLAFLDRADIKQYIGHPSKGAIYKIYSSCINELMRTGLMESEPLHSLATIEHEVSKDHDNRKAIGNSKKLLHMCEQSVGLSGRSLRKIPFLVYARLLSSKICTLSTFLDSMSSCVEQEKKSSTTMPNYKI